MTHTTRRTALSGLAAVALVSLPLLAAAQENRAAAGSSAAGTGPAASGGPAGGGSSAGGGGGSTSSGGGGGSSSSGGGSSSNGYAGGGGGGSRFDGGGRHTASGASGVAVTRGDRGRDSSGSGSSGGRSSSGGRAVAVAGSDAGTGSGGRAVNRDGGTREARTPDGGAAAVPPHARPRDGDEPVVGTAVPRGSVPPAGGGSVPIIPGGGYYPFYPWWLGGTGYYGGYYGGYYDPWFGGYPDPGYSQGSGGSYADEGSLRLKIKPREAEVYVDGYFVGVVDQFDGTFQRLHIETGPHRIEVRAQGYETLTFDVRITPDHSTTYQGELKRIQ